MRVDRIKLKSETRVKEALGGAYKQAPPTLNQDEVINFGAICA